MASLNKVNAGDPLSFSAGDYNAFVDAARGYLSRQHDLPHTPKLFSRRYDIVLVRNDTEVSLDRFHIVGLASAIFTPEDAAFQNTTVMRGVVPEEDQHEGMFGVTLEPIAREAFGHALVAGVVPVLLSAEGTPRFAEIAPGATDHLIASESGSATVLWREEGDELRWGLVALGKAMSTGGVGGVVVRSIPDPLGTRLMVETVKLDENGEWRASGDTKDMPTYPFVPAGAYEMFRLLTGDPHRMGDVLPTCFIGRIEVVLLHTPMIPTVVSGDEPHRGCRPGVPE